MKLQPGDTIAGRYELVSDGPADGIGPAWVATEAAGGRAVLLRAVRLDVGSAEVACERLRMAGARLARAGVARAAAVLDAFVHEGALFLVEHAAAETVADLLARHGRLTPAEVAGALAAAAEALDEAHAAGLAHLALCPESLRTDPSGPAVVGVGVRAALLGQSESGLAALLKPHYAPPEVIAGAGSDRSDVYSLAAIAYQLLTGSPPFVGATPADVLSQQRTAEPPDPRLQAPWLPSELSATLLSALSKDPSDRPSSCASLVAVFRAAASRPSEARSRRAWLAVATLLALAIGAVLAMDAPTGAPPPRAVARPAAIEIQPVPAAAAVRPEAPAGEEDLSRGEAEGFIARARRYDAEGNIVLALRAARQAVLRRQSDPAIARYAASVALAAGEPAEAEELLASALDGGPGDPETEALRAAALAARRDLSGARAALAAAGSPAAAARRVACIFRLIGYDPSLVLGAGSECAPEAGERSCQPLFEEAAKAEREGDRLAARRYLEEITLRRFTCDDPQGVIRAYWGLLKLARASGEMGWADAVLDEMAKLWPSVRKQLERP